MDKAKSRVLIADDEYHICEGLGEALRRSGYDVEVAHDGSQAAALLQSEDYQAAILDLRMPGVDGLTLLERAKTLSPDTGVIIVTAYGEVSTAVDAMRSGAYDFLTKPVDLKRLRLSLQRLLEHQALVAENKHLRARLGSAETSDEIVHHSESMKRVCATIEQAAGTEVPVLVTGETGTGKELVARSIHRRSARHGGPLVAMNCGAIPDTLFESELFGHARGAFTGAHADRPGRFASARGGTLFFDEVGEIPLENQVNLLRVLEEKAYTPVGGTTPEVADVRTIFATNRDLEVEVRERRFREDLYYRINVVPVRLPPLRERRDDIPLLVETFLEEICSLHEKPRARLTPDAMQALLGYAWPGNVRELKNTIERVVVTCPDRLIDTHSLPSRLREAPEAETSFEVGLGASIASVERMLIEKTLEGVTSNRREAARILGISVRALQYKLKAYRGA